MIYGDVLLVINFSMDFLALFVTAKIMHVKLKKIKVTASAIVGAVYSLMILLSGLSGFPVALISLAVSFIMTFLAFGKRKPVAFLKNTVVFYAVNFLIGGGITAICNLLNIWQNKRNFVVNGTFDTAYGDVPFGALALLAGGFGLFSLISGRIAKRKSARIECVVQITLDGNSVVLNGLFDSGNLLREPISEKPVIVAPFKAVRPIIPVGLLNFIKTKNTVGLDSCPFKSKIRLIPASTVGKSGLLPAVFPDCVKVNGNEADVYIAVDAEAEDFGGFQAIVPDEIRL